ncbi:MAG TPA: dTDP-4-dehydrorhamnose 3,5-epimerase [Ignavibacteriaceae bacterium]
MKITESKFKGVFIIELDIFNDSRGYFFETFNAKRYKDLGINLDFVQDNISVSKKGTLRGLHYQVPPKAQGKLCHVIKGSVLDAAVDLRFGSPTFGQHFIIELSEKNHTQIFIPVGFAHGFAVLSDEAIFQYKCSEFYSKEHERSIRFDDPDLNINWGIENPIVSNKDRNGKFFKDIEKDFKV